MASALWRTMQRVESNRHQAAQLEAAAWTADLEFGRLLRDIAAQRREIAEQAYTLLQGGAVAAVNPLGFARAAGRYGRPHGPSAPARGRTR